MDYKVTEKGTLSVKEGAPFSMLLENLVSQFQGCMVLRYKKVNTLLSAGIAATILFMLTTTAVKYTCKRMIYFREAADA